MPAHLHFDQSEIQKVVGTHFELGRFKVVVFVDYLLVDSRTLSLGQPSEVVLMITFWLITFLLHTQKGDFFFLN